MIAPEEDNLIITVHQYWPVMFTMQGERWLGPTPFGRPESWLGTTWQGDARQPAELDQGFAAVGRYAESQNRPVFIGEFGTSDNADMASRARWTRFNWRRELLHALIPDATVNESAAQLSRRNSESSASFRLM